MSNEPVKLRPHHGMCLAYFVGYGYSEDFSSHMGRFLAGARPDMPVRLAVDTDAVCAGCPNNLDGVCEKPEKVAGYDRAVLELCGLEEGVELPFGHFAALVQECVLEPGLRRDICGGCQWDVICSAQASRWKEADK